MSRRRYVSGFYAVGTVFLITISPAAAQMGQPGWIADPKSGCQVWIGYLPPKEMVTFTWSGACQDGRAQGEGVLQWFIDRKPSARYEGEYQQGKKSGHGVYTDPSGNTYDGEFRDDQPNGHGADVMASGARYVGEFRDGKRDGHGIFTYTNGNTYDGEFHDGDHNGHGIFTFSNGDRYDGEFSDNKFDGHGIYTWADGHYYDGEYRSGVANGQGALVYKTRSFRGTWSDGCMKDDNMQLAVGRAPSSCP
jgi:hypothetical protein